MTYFRKLWYGAGIAFGAQNASPPERVDEESGEGTHHQYYGNTPSPRGSSPPLNFPPLSELTDHTRTTEPKAAWDENAFVLPGLEAQAAKAFEEERARERQQVDLMEQVLSWQGPEGLQGFPDYNQWNSQDFDTGSEQYYDGRDDFGTQQLLNPQEFRSQLRAQAPEFTPTTSHQFWQLDAKEEQNPNEFHEVPQVPVENFLDPSRPEHQSLMQGPVTSLAAYLGRIFTEEYQLSFTKEMKNSVQQEMDSYILANNGNPSEVVTIMTGEKIHFPKWIDLDGNEVGLNQRDHAGFVSDPLYSGLCPLEMIFLLNLMVETECRAKGTFKMYHEATSGNSFVVDSAGQIQQQPPSSEKIQPQLVAQQEAMVQRPGSVPVVPEVRGQEFDYPPQAAPQVPPPQGLQPDKIIRSAYQPNNKAPSRKQFTWSVPRVFPERAAASHVSPPPNAVPPPPQHVSRGVRTGLKPPPTPPKPWVSKESLRRLLNKRPAEALREVVNSKSGEVVFLPVKETTPSETLTEEEKAARRREWAEWQAMPKEERKEQPYCIRRYVHPLDTTANWAMIEAQRAAVESFRESRYWERVQRDEKIEAQSKDLQRKAGRGDRRPLEEKLWDEFHADMEKASREPSRLPQKEKRHPEDSRKGEQRQAEVRDANYRGIRANPTVVQGPVEKRRDSLKDKVKSGKLQIETGREGECTSKKYLQERINTAGGFQKELEAIERGKKEHLKSLDPLGQLRGQLNENFWSKERAAGVKTVSPAKGETKLKERKQREDLKGRERLEADCTRKKDHPKSDGKTLEGCFELDKHGIPVRVSGSITPSKDSVMRSPSRWADEVPADSTTEEEMEPFDFKAELQKRTENDFECVDKKRSVEKVEIDLNQRWTAEEFQREMQSMLLEEGEEMQKLYPECFRESSDGKLIFSPAEYMTFDPRCYVRRARNARRLLKKPDAETGRKGMLTYCGYCAALCHNKTGLTWTHRDQWKGSEEWTFQMLEKCQTHNIDRCVKAAGAVGDVEEKKRLIAECATKCGKKMKETRGRLAASLAKGKGKGGTQ